MRKLFLVFFVVLAAGAFAAEKTTVAFIGLEASGVSEASADGIADTLLDALINTRRFEIVERERLNALLEEQGLALSGCTTMECFVQVGQLAGASKVIVGKVSKVGETYTVTVRVVDVFVGKVELSESAESNSLDGLLAASREMAGRLAASIPVVGTVVSVSGDTVKLNLGTQEGVKKGDTVELYRLGEEYYDPDTGRFLGRDIEELGEAKITRVLADELSEALYSGDIPPITGDKVRLAGSIEVGEPEVVTTTTATVQPRRNTRRNHLVDFVILPRVGYLTNFNFGHSFGYGATIGYNISGDTALALDVSFSRWEDYGDWDYESNLIFEIFAGIQGYLGEGASKFVWGGFLGYVSAALDRGLAIRERLGFAIPFGNFMGFEIGISVDEVFGEGGIAFLLYPALGVLFTF